ncbi:MAG: ABC transporter ATP-binding protein [Acetivibrio ethanolgignens]
MLEIRNLTKTYKGGKKAVSNLSLKVEPGDICGFIGHNGAGKTTTIKCIVGIHDFEAGEILVDGISVKENSLKCKSVLAYIPDNPDLYEYLTGIQYLNFIADIFGVPVGERKKRIQEEADDFEITQALGDLISSYSHGMKQKLAIIGALLHRPMLLILDEPFVGLDPKAALTLKNKMHKLCEEGSAIFFSTHVLDVAEKLCNKVAIIRKGELVAAGDTKELTKGESLEDVFMEVTRDE